jgi:uncharacterized protein
MLIDDLKKAITTAMKGGDTVARDILRLALGEIQTTGARKAEKGEDEKLTDDETAAIFRKLIKSNEETLGLSGEGERATTLRREIEVLSALLPKGLSLDEIVALLAPVEAQIKEAKSDGQATGVAMKHLKTSGATVQGNDAQAAVKKIRG